MKKIAIWKRLLIMLRLEDIAGWELITLSTTCFNKANLGDKLSSKIRTRFSSNLTSILCESVRLVHNWESNQSFLTSIETQHLFLMVFFWLICCHQQTIDYVIVQTPDSFSRKVVIRTGWNNKRNWRRTEEISLLSKCSIQFPTNAKIFSCNLAQKNLSGFSRNA